MLDISHPNGYPIMLIIILEVQSCGLHTILRSTSGDDEEKDRKRRTNPQQVQPLCSHHGERSSLSTLSVCLSLVLLCNATRRKKALPSCFPLITRSVHDSSPFSCNPVAWNTIENNMSREHGYAKPFTNNGENCLTYFHDNLHAYLH